MVRFIFDSIADILSFAVCADDLGIERAAFSELTEGCGLTVRRSTD